MGKMLRMAIFCSKPIKKCLFRRHYDVIQQNDGIFRFRKCLQCVPSHIFCGIWDEIIKLEQKVALDGSNCHKWWYFAEKMVKMVLFDVRMTSYNKITAFLDFENASNVFLAKFSEVYGMKLEQKVALDGSNCRKWWYFA